MSKPVRTNHAYKVDNWGEAFVLGFRAVRWLIRQSIRFRTELLLLTVLIAVYASIRHEIGPSLASWMVLAGVVLTGVWGRTRRLVLVRLSCSVTRRRLQAVFRETRVANDGGKVPLITRSRRTPTGEQYALVLRIGQSCELLEGRVEELRAAVRSRDVRVIRHENRSHLVTLEVLRKDTLAGLRIDSPLVEFAAGIDAQAAASVRMPTPDESEQS